MKRIFYTLLFISGFCFTAGAQIQNSKQTGTPTQITSHNDKMNFIKSCEELNEQLTRLFGKNYTIADARVVEQLEKNIADKKASRCIRKKSLYGIYGEDYVNHLHLINDVNEISNTKQ